MAEHSGARALPPPRRNAQDIGLGFILGLFALIGGSLLLLVLLAYLLFPQEVKDDRFARPFPTFPAPRLQPSPPADMGQFHAEEMRTLNSAGWQDKAAGTLHMPIDQAMRAVATEGIADWPAGNKTVSQGDRR